MTKPKKSLRTVPVSFWLTHSEAQQVKSRILPSEPLPSGARRLLLEYAHMEHYGVGTMPLRRPSGRRPLSETL